VIGPQISRLFFYPIKSFRGLEVKSLRLTTQGALLDRQWMLVDGKNNFITQRTMPELARIGVALEDEARLVLTQNGKFITDFGLEEKENELTVKVWKDTELAHEVSSEVSADLSKCFGKSVRLVRINDQSERPGRFSDDEPLLVVTEESLQALAVRAKESFFVARFRPNIVVRHAIAHTEDSWGQFKIGTLSFQGVKPCTRCRITQTHPLTGEVGDEPMKTLLTYRKAEKGVAFGYYYSNDQEGEIHTGQNLEF
jgi:uncharacterized protein YcbX